MRSGTADRSRIAKEYGTTRGEETAQYSTDGAPILRSEPNFTCSSVVMLGMLLSTLVCAWVWVFNYLGGLGRENKVDSDLYFNWHPFLMTTSFLVLSFSALSYRFLPGLHTTQKTVHGVLNTAVLAMLIAGLVITVRWHNLTGLPHMFSVHSWMGVLALTLLTLQYALGFVAFVYPSCHPDTAAYFKLFHKWLGVTAYATLFATILLGLLNKQRFIPGDLFAGPRVFANTLSILFALMGATVLWWLGPTTPVYSVHASYAAIPDRDEAI